jgi:hypothetical protein
MAHAAPPSTPAIASALATQRFSDSPATIALGVTAIASALTTQRLPATAPALTPLKPPFAPTAPRAARGQAERSACLRWRSSPRREGRGLEPIAIGGPPPQPLALARAGAAAHGSRPAHPLAALSPPGADAESARDDRAVDADAHPAPPLRPARAARPRRPHPPLPRTGISATPPVAYPARARRSPAADHRRAAASAKSPTRSSSPTPPGSARSTSH